MAAALLPKGWKVLHSPGRKGGTPGPALVFLWGFVLWKKSQDLIFFLMFL